MSAANDSDETDLVPKFWREKYEAEARKNWDLFYKRNKTNFFRDRHWFRHSFPELLKDESQDGASERTLVLELGCGVGNAVFPLLEENPRLFFYAVDFSKRAIDLLKEHPRYDVSDVQATVCDATCESLVTVGQVPAGSVDYAILCFVLSAISPEKMAASLHNLRTVLKHGGRVLFRDYAVNDLAQQRFGNGHKLAHNFYVKSDGTRVYYFSAKSVSELFSSCGFEVLETEYVERTIVNRKLGLDMHRRWLQAKFRNLPTTASAASSSPLPSSRPPPQSPLCPTPCPALAASAERSTTSEMSPVDSAHLRPVPAATPSSPSASASDPLRSSEGASALVQTVEISSSQPSAAPSSEHSLEPPHASSLQAPSTAPHGFT